MGKTPLVGLVAVVLACLPCDAADIAPQTIAVSESYNHQAFAYQQRLHSERPQFRIYRLTYPSPVVSPVVQNNTIPADYYLPRDWKPSDPPRPAVICLHILDGNEPLTDLMCSVLALRGIPAISFKLPYYGSRGLPQGPEALAENPELFAGAIAQAGEDIRRTIDLLSARPEVDSKKIGITGVSLGGIIAAAAAGADPRLHRAGLILAGGDLLPIIYHARETRPLSQMLQKLPAMERASIEAKITRADPLQFAPALRKRAEAGQVLMINASEDEVIPKLCSDKLAKALGITDRVVWLSGLGHYTAMAELPRALKITADFFARDLPPGVKPAAPDRTARPTPVQQVAGLLQQSGAMLGEPQPGLCHIVDLEVHANGPGWQPIEGRIRIVRGREGRFSLHATLPRLGTIALGYDQCSWMLTSKKILFLARKEDVRQGNWLTWVGRRHEMKLRMIEGLVSSIALVPEMLHRWIAVEGAQTAAGVPILRIQSADAKNSPGEIRIAFQDDARAPRLAEFAVAGLHGTVRFHAWRVNALATDALFQPPEATERQEVHGEDLDRMLAAMVNFAAERIEHLPDPAVTGQASITIARRDPAGHGLLAYWQGKRILMLSGTPAQMGAAHGLLLRDSVQKLAERSVYFVGGGDTLQSGQWFFERMAEIQRRTLPHIPPRFFEECDALSQAAGVSTRDGRYANLFPERFHCSGVAMRGKATTGGRVLHARVLDYMSDIKLQEGAAIMVLMPDGRNRWISLGYAGFIGTVTAMNEHGLAVGEMGGRGEGQWDGMPMSFLLRDIMERARNVKDALAMLRATPRTCEYYYVLSDRSGTLRAVECRPQEIKVLEPGQQDPRLPHVPDDVVLISGKDRAAVLVERIKKNYGRIEVPSLIEIIKRPVAMPSNLHNAVFAPQTLDMWCADASEGRPACDEPYAQVNLRALIEFYQKQMAAAVDGNTAGN